MTGRARGSLRIIDGSLSPRNDPVARLHRFQGEHPEVEFTASHWGGQGRYIACVPAGAIPGDPRGYRLQLDLTGLMDQLDDYLPPGDSDPDPESA